MQNKLENQVNAGFFVRLAAYLIDSLIVGAALLMVRIPVSISSWWNPDNILVKDFLFAYSITDIVCYLLTSAYFILLTYYTGATLGKKVLHLRVVSVEERKMTFFEVAFRETVGRFLSGLILDVGYLMIGIHKEKHGLHDLLSDTEVIYCHEKKIEVENPVEKKEAETATYMPATYMPVIEKVEDVAQPESEESLEETTESESKEKAEIE